MTDKKQPDGSVDVTHAAPAEVPLSKRLRLPDNFRDVTATAPTMAIIGPVAKPRKGEQ